MKTILFGFMPFPSVGGFTIPLYKTPDGVLVCHELNSEGTHITGFDTGKEYTENPLHMMKLPEQLRFPVCVGDPRIWILTFGKNPSLDRDMNFNGLIIGTAEQLLPYEEIMTKVFGFSKVAEVFGKK